MVAPELLSDFSNSEQQFCNAENRSPTLQFLSGERRGDNSLLGAFAVADQIDETKIPEYVGEGYEHKNTVSNYESFEHQKFTEASHLELVHQAWQVHAQGYIGMGFVNDKALTPEGFLSADIDKARGPLTDYFLARDPQDSNKHATIRKIHLPGGGDYHDLPAYALGASNLTLSGRKLIRGIENQDTKLKEIAALARTPETKPEAVYELIRRVIQEGQGKDETWFFNVVSTTYNSFVRSFGKQNFTVIGQEVTFNDSRVGASISLIPTIVYPDKFISNVLDDYDTAKSNVVRRSLLGSFMFLSNGLDPHFMTPHMQNTRHRELEAISLRKAR